MTRSAHAARTAVVVAGLLGILSACGHDGPRLPAWPSSLNAEMVINAYVPATGAEYASGAGFREAQLQLEDISVSRCMAHRGMAAPPDTAREVAAGDVDNSQFPALGRISSTRRFIPATAGQGVQAGQSGGAYSTALSACDGAAGSLFQETDREGQALQARWMNDVTTIEASPPVRALLPGYQACLAEAGVPASQVPGGTAGQASGSSASALGNFLAWESGQEDRGAGTAAHWASVFVRCARPVVRETETAQTAARKAFLRDHRAQAAGVERAACQETSRAEQQYGTASPVK